MFEIANAVDAEHEFDIPIAEGVMCRALAHADTHNYTIEIVPDCVVCKRFDGWSYHPEFKEIRERAIDFMKKEMPEYDNAEYIGRWNGKYVYSPFLNSGERLITGFPIYILLDKGTVEEYIDTDLIERGHIIKTRR